MSNFKWLGSAGALAAGEYLAALHPELSGLDAVSLMGGLLTALYGYGLRWRGWWLAATVMLGLGLGWSSVRAESERFRMCPWLRGRLVRRMASEPDAWRTQVRRELGRRVAIGLDPQSETVGLNRAILLGERGRLSRRTQRLFVDSGAMHIFAISGLHIMAIATVLAWVMRIVLFVPARWARALAMPVLWGYVLVIGAPPSAVRAAMMASLGALAPVCWRRPNGLIAWSLTFWTVHLLRPALIVNVGSVMSFAVMLSIQLTSDGLREYGRRWWTGLLTTAVAWAVGVPIAAHVFARITPSGLVANLVLLSAAQCTVYAGTLGLSASLVSTTLAAHLNGLSALFTELMVRFCEGVAGIPGGSISVRPWNLWACAAWYAGLIVLTVLWRLCRRRNDLWPQRLAHRRLPRPRLRTRVANIIAALRAVDGNPLPAQTA